MGEKYNKEVGTRLYSKRKELKLTRAELGKKIKLHESTIKRYEDGEIKTLDIEKIKEFAEALETTPAYLMGWKDTSDADYHSELYNFEYILAETEWWDETQSDCDIVGVRANLGKKALAEDPELNEDLKCPYGLNTEYDCQNCKHNKTYYFFYKNNSTNKYFRFNEEEFDVIRKCLKPYLELRIQELVSSRLPVHDTTCIPSPEIPLALNKNNHYEPQLLAAHNDDNDETQQELMNKDIERIKNMRKK